MELRFSILARNREFGRAMNRIHPRFQPLVQGFGRIQLANPIHSAILVGITDDKSPDFFEIVPNDDGFFQIIVGCEMKSPDGELVREVFDILRRAARACPFTTADQSSVQAVFDKHERDIVGAG